MPKPVFLAAAIAFLFAAVEVQADEASFVETAALFDAAWVPSTNGLSEAEALYHKLRDEGRAGPQVTYAYALVQMRNLKYDQAKRLLDQVIGKSDDDLSARRAKIWILMIGRDYTTALIELQDFVKQAVGGKQQLEPGDERLTEFAGRVMGFIDGPAASAIDEHVRGDYRSRLLSLLSAEQKKSFEAAYTAVQRRFAELDIDRQQTKADAKAEGEQRRERLLDDLKRERDTLEREQASLQSRAEAAAAEFKRELDRIDTQLAPLTTRQARLEAQAAALVREIASLQAEVARLLDLSDWVEDPGEAFRLRAEARRLDVAWRRFEVDLRGVQGELAGVAAQRVTLAGERQATLARQRAIANQVGRRVSEIRKADRRITGEERKAAQPVTGNTPAAHSLAIRARAFTTYESFPFEEERARLLQSLSRDMP